MEQVAYLQKWFGIIPKRFWRQQDRVVKIGIVFTICFFAFVLLFGFAPSCESSADCNDPSSKWRVFWSAPPNVVGDTLAGVAGVLAFLWIIVTVLLQSKELAAQRQELKQARNEYAKMAEAQEKQVELMSAQARIFEDEQRQRTEEREERLLLEKLRSFVVSLNETPNRGLTWHFSNFEIREHSGENGPIEDRSLCGDNREKQSADETIIELRRRLPSLYESLINLERSAVDSRLPNNRLLVTDLVSQLTGILELKANLSSAQVERLSRLRIPEIVEYLEKLASDTELWEGNPQ